MGNSDMQKITQRIVSVSLKSKEPQKAETSNVVQMHEKIERPEILEGRTYKVTSPAVESALYITINDIVLNPGTPHETRRPFEIFINSRDSKSYQWVVALTRLMSAVFRKGGDVTFLIEELNAIFDPQGGYWSGGKWMPSVMAEIGNVIERHLKHVGIVPTDKEVATSVSVGSQSKGMACPKCRMNTYVVSEGCATCMSCGYSKCG